MTFSPAHRRSIILQCEGTVMRFAAEHGDSAGAEAARCQIDGIMNAMIRIEGAESAARYAFALSDRVAGGLRAATEFHPLKAAAAGPPADAAAKPPAAPPKLRSRWAAYLWGALHGAALAAWFFLARAS